MAQRDVFGRAGHGPFSGLVPQLRPAVGPPLDVAQPRERESSAFGMRLRS